VGLILKWILKIEDIYVCGGGGGGFGCMAQERGRVEGFCEYGSGHSSSVKVVKCPVHLNDD
jgi:hypothetical protein